MLSLSVKNVPHGLARALRVRADANRRSLQGELLHILEAAVGEQEKPFDLAALMKDLKAVGLTHSRNESTAMIREDRDRR